MRDKNEKILHIGADLDPDLVSEFRFQAKSRKFKIKEIMRRWLEWWMNLDPILQQQFYHWNGESEPKINFPSAEREAAEAEADAARIAAKQRRKSRQHKRGASA